MIAVGLIAGVLAYYWLLPKWLAARIVRQYNVTNRSRDGENRP